MKLWSRGLGRTEVSMDFRYYTVVKDKEDGSVCILGNMRDPVNWEFRIVMEPEDIAGFMKMAFHWSIIWLVIKNAFKYFIYLFNRKKFEEEGDLEQKVLSAYDTLMRRSRPGGRPGRKPGARKTGGDEKGSKTQAA